MWYKILKVNKRSSEIKIVESHRRLVNEKEITAENKKIFDEALKEGIKATKNNSNYTLMKWLVISVLVWIIIYLFFNYEIWQYI